MCLLHFYPFRFRLRKDIRVKLPLLTLLQEKERQEKATNAILSKWGSTALWQLTMPSPLAYPQTDHQYPSGPGVAPLASHSIPCSSKMIRNVYYRLLLL
jgi:hypothetical protein